MMLLKKLLALMLALTILLSMPMVAVEAKTEPKFDLYIGGEPISQDKKGIDFTAKDILVKFNSSWKLNINRSLKEIKIMSNGKTDETFKFDTSFTVDRLTLTLKDSVPAEKPPYRLNPSTLYTIHIPEGVFIDDKKNPNSKIDFNFVTRGEMGQEDLLKSSRPADNTRPQGRIDKIEFEYVDDIVVNIDKLKEGIAINLDWLDEEIKSPDKPELVANSIDDFNIQVKDSKLTLQPKVGKEIANFCTYNISIPEKILHLKNSPDIDNDKHGVSFTTYQMLESTYPTNNQGGVEVKPTIKFVFKHPVTLIGDKDEITLESQVGEKYPLTPEDMNLSSDGKTLSINVGKKDEHPLRRNTLYKVTVPKGIIQFTDKILNENITLNFTTRGEGQSPKITKCSSNTHGTDNITSISNTRLSRDGSIFIHFDRDIKFEKNSTKNEIMRGTRLYKIPKADEVAYDATGVLYDKKFEFSGDITEGELRKSQQEIDIQNIQIVNKNTLQIKPRLPLINLNQYHFTMDKHLIEDIHGYTMEEDINFYFWTAPSPEKPAIKWEGIQGLDTGVSVDDRGSAGITYTVSGTPVYDDQNPIVFKIEGEVMPKAGDIASLRHISLAEGYDTKKAVKIDKFHFEYYFEGNKKKTRLSIYPESELDVGKYYVLKIPSSTLQARSGSFLSPMVMNFTVAGKRDSDAGIYNLEPDTFKFYDIYRGNAEFTIKGHNFNENVEYVELKMTSGEAAGTVTGAVYKKDIEFKSVTELKIKLRDPEIVEKLVKGGSGEYSIRVYFKGANSPVESPKPLTILPRGKPVVLATDPDGDIWYNEKRLNPKTIDGTTRYFLKITFDDPDGSLSFDTESGLNLLQTSTVYSEGQNEVSMLDREFLNYIQTLEDEKDRKFYINQYIFEKNASAKRAYLYIPVKPLRSQTTYNVMINSDIVSYKGPDQASEGNDVIAWSFTTTAIPVVTRVDMGSVVEDYDADEPIWLQGDFFDSRNVEVMFNNIRARRVRVVTDEDDKTFLEVYLPSGRNRLEPGIYNIRVWNDRDHEFEMFGSLSVIKQGDYIPNEDYRVKYEGRIGEVLGSTKRSEDTLVLDGYYTDRRYVEVDLDELMGPEVLLRKIQFDGRRRDRIGTLETTSKWADIFIYDVGIDGDRDEEPELKLGRVEPPVAQNLKERLGRQKPKSELIQVIGEDVRFTSVRLVIPYRESNGDNLKVLRYDAFTRNFYEEPFFVDKLDKTVTVSSYSSGIFVVVEK